MSDGQVTRTVIAGLRLLAEWNRHRAREAAFAGLNVAPALARAQQAEDLADEYARGILPLVAARWTPPRLIPLPVWCEQHQVSPRTGRHWAATGKLPATRDGRAWLIDPDTPPPTSRRTTR